MIFNKFPIKVTVELEQFDENEMPLPSEEVSCEVIMIARKLIEGTDESKETFVVICHDKEGNIYERFLNEVKLEKSLINKNLLNENRISTGQDFAQENRRRKKNRNRTDTSEYWQDRTETRHSGFDRDTAEGQTDLPEGR